MTKTLTLIYCFILLFLSGCSIIDDEPNIVTLNCRAFDLRVQEIEWIAFPEGIEPIFTHENDTINLSSGFFSSEPFELEYEKRFRLFPDGQVRDCFAYYASEHVSENREISIRNIISYLNDKENVRFALYLNNLNIYLLVEGDSLKIDVLNTSFKEIDLFNLEYYTSMDFNGVTYFDIAKIKYDNPSSEFQEAIIARNFGLLEFQKNDAIWQRK